MASTMALAGSAGRWGPLWGSRPWDWAGTEDQQTPIYEEAIRCVGIAPGQRVLDIGCGSGAFLRAAAERGALVAGLDASASLIEIARMRVPDAVLRVGDMQFLSFEDDSFDLVTGFSSFFFAADMVAAVREAGRVAKPDAPVVIQVWGRPERCALDAMKRVAAPFLPAPKPGTPVPPALWEPGVLEEIATEAGLTPESAFDLSWAFEYPDEETLGRGMLAAGNVAAVPEPPAREALRAAIVDALEPHRTGDGGYRLENEWHYLVARA